MVVGLPKINQNFKATDRITVVLSLLIHLVHFYRHLPPLYPLLTSTPNELVSQEWEHVVSTGYVH